jgi:hypothetical protein
MSHEAAVPNDLDFRYHPRRGSIVARSPWGGDSTIETPYERDREGRIQYRAYRRMTGRAWESY